jgi:hypothetical protein
MIGILLSTLDLEVKTIRYRSGTGTFLGSLQDWINDRYEGALDERKQLIYRSHFLRHFFRPFGLWIQPDWEI